MSGFDEAQRRHREMLTEWAGLGHPQSACSGHTYPLPDCPAPSVHTEVFPPQQVVPKVTAFDETAALWAVMNEDPAAAQSLIASMLPGERHEFEAHLSVLMSLVWSAA